VLQCADVLTSVVREIAIAAVPKLKVVLARVLPVLASIKQDNMKWVFATSMWKFCDAVVTYVADIGQVILRRTSLK
jgi:hypothetical protein